MFAFFFSLVGGPKEQGLPEQLLVFFCFGAWWEVSETTE